MTPAPFRLRVLNLGAGVQSTTLALMAAHGEIEPPDCAIFADTQSEPRAVYEHLEWLMSPNVLPFPVHVVTAGNLKANIQAGADGKRWASIPAFTRTGRVRQQCTSEFKIRPITRQIRILAGLHGKRSPNTPVVETWLGISVDEAHRMKPAPNLWQKHRWPLIEKGMSRRDCLAWMRAHDYPEPPKSACVFCPNRSDQRWRDMRDNRPAEFAEAVALDTEMRRAGRFRLMTDLLFIHASCRPLGEVDFTDLFDEGFGNSCDGVCGV